MQEMKLEIRVMSRKEVDLAIEWAAKEGWNPGFYDAECFYASDPNGFMIGLLNDEPVAIISVVKYGESFGFLGFYIVKPEYRGKGYGIQIWNAGMKYLNGRNIGLDGVVTQQDNYRKSGFKLAYRNIRYESNGGGNFPNDSEIVKLSSLPFETVESYDKVLFSANRTQFINCWINQPNHNALGIMQNGKLAGYGIIRKCRVGYKIGPLFGDTPQLAETLFLALKSGLKPTETVYLDTPELNNAAVALAKRYNMKVVFETARMYTEEINDIPINKIFGVTTFELG